MKRTYFLDKIYNANIIEFDNIIKAVVENLKQEQYPYSYVKKNGKWLLEIEKENDLVSVLFDDYSMKVNSKLKQMNVSYSNNWQKIFNKFLHKNQKYYYKKGLIELKNNEFVISAEEVKNAVEI